MSDIADLPFYFGIISDRYAEAKLKTQKIGAYMLHKNVLGDYVIRYVGQDKRIQSFSIKKDEKTIEVISDEISYALDKLIEEKKIISHLHKPSWFISADDVVVGVKVLGTGNFSNVLTGTYKGQKAAIKILKAGDSTFDDLCTELMRESTALGEVATSNYCIKMFGTVTESKTTMIVMELMSSTLLSVLKSGDVPQQELLCYTYQLLQALTFLEEHSLVHRDIAARNLLFNRYGILKLTDFGLAGHNSEFVAYTERGKHAPLRWRAPETVKEICSTYTIKSDVWSFAVTLLEIFNKGKQPREDIKADGFAEIFRKSPIEIFHPIGAPEEVAAFQTRCWDWDPLQRPSFGEMRGSVKQLLKFKYGEPVIEKLVSSKIPNVKQLTMSEYDILCQYNLEVEEFDNTLLDETTKKLK